MPQDWRNPAERTQSPGAVWARSRPHLGYPAPGRRTLGRVARSAQHRRVGELVRRTTSRERDDVVNGQVRRWVGGAVVARAPVAVLAAPGPQDSGAEALPGPRAVQGVMPAAVGLPGVLGAATTSAAGDDAADRAQLHSAIVGEAGWRGLFACGATPARPWQSEPAQDQGMDRWSIPAGELEAAFARAAVLQREIERKERLLGRRVQVLAKGIADLMHPGEMHYRRGIGVHAFPVDGVNCLAATYTEEERDRFTYRYAVLCGGEAAKRALNTAALNPGDSDEPGSRRIAMATYGEFVDFVERLPAYLKDVTRNLETRIGEADDAAASARQIGRQVSARTRTGRSQG